MDPTRTLDSLRNRIAPNQLTKWGGHALKAALIALYIQKSDGDSFFETVLCICLGTIGTLLISEAGRLLIHQPWPSAFEMRTVAVISICVGLVLIGVSWSIIDEKDTDYTQLVAVGENSVEGDGFSLRNLKTSNGTGFTRISVEVVNTDNAPLVLNQIEFYITKSRSFICWIQPLVYKILRGCTNWGNRRFT